MKTMTFTDDSFSVIRDAIEDKIKEYNSKIKRLDNSHSYDEETYNLKREKYCSEQEKLIELLRSFDSEE